MRCSPSYNVYSLMCCSPCSCAITVFDSIALVSGTNVASPIWRTHARNTFTVTMYNKSVPDALISNIQQVLTSSIGMSKVNGI